MMLTDTLSSIDDPSIYYQAFVLALVFGIHFQYSRAYGALSHPRSSIRAVPGHV